MEYSNLFVPSCENHPVAGLKIGKAATFIGRRDIRGDGVPRESAIGLAQPARSTWMKASCGMLTRPMLFIRFLPSFCFSSSLRLRVMSPP